MAEDRQAYIRFCIQVVVNMYACKKAQSIVGKYAKTNQTNITKSWLMFIMFGLLILGINLAIFFLFKETNLYQQLGISRSMSHTQIQEWGQSSLKVLKNRGDMGNTINKLITLKTNKIHVLIHPARRLTYDSFGLVDIQQTWVFYNFQFIFQTIIQSAMFYIFCTSLIIWNRKTEELKQSFNIQFFAVIILFIWEIDLIIRTEQKLHNFQTDWLDCIFNAFPVFQRRKMIRIMIIPCMSLAMTFAKFYMISPIDEKLQIFGFNSKLKKQTNAVRQTLKHIKVDSNIENSLIFELQKYKVTHRLQSQIYMLQRELLKSVLFIKGEVFGPDVYEMLKYYLLK